MATKCTLFNTVFRTITDFCEIKPSNVAGIPCEEFKEPLNEDTIRAWRSRGRPETDNFEQLLFCLQSILSKREVEQQGLRDRIAAVWPEGPVWDEGETAAGYVSRLLKAAYQKSGGSIQTAPPKRRLVAFGLNGTLFKGVRYSWELAFQAAGLDWKRISKKRKEEFEDKRITYEKWCEEDCRALKEAGLTKQKLEELARSKITKVEHLREAIQKIKDAGHKVAVISGGVDTVLYALLPDAKELFDAIYINRFIYNKETGVLQNIIPTRYDWDDYLSGVEGKKTAIVRLCERYRISHDDTVFVGDDFNDMGALAFAYMKIFSFSSCEDDPTRGKSRNVDERSLPKDAIHESGNDLLRVADRIIAWNFGD